MPVTFSLPHHTIDLLTFFLCNKYVNLLTSYRHGVCNLSKSSLAYIFYSFFLLSICWTTYTLLHSYMHYVQPLYR